METSREVDEVSEKIEQFYRDATPDDVARVMRGEAVEARFLDEESEGWRDGEFLGGYRRYHKLAPRFIDLDGATYLQCQVYDPPEILKNKPDPGEGYRLLEKFPPEDKLPTDEYWNTACSQWLPAGGSSAEPQVFRFQANEVWYRRRIANNPTSSNSSRSREDIPSGWRLLSKDEDRLASDAYWSQGCKEWVLIGNDRVEYANDKTGKWHAIRRMEDFVLVEGFMYTLPGGKVIRITAKGFEVV
jgi:hypothetical protein